jgi:hypothetical protein
MILHSPGLGLHEATSTSACCAFEPDQHHQVGIRCLNRFCSLFTWHHFSILEIECSACVSSFESILYHGLDDTVQVSVGVATNPISSNAKEQLSRSHDLVLDSA